MIRACTVTGCDRTLTVKYTAVTVYGYGDHPYFSMTLMNQISFLSRSLTSLSALVKTTLEVQLQRYREAEFSTLARILSRGAQSPQMGYPVTLAVEMAQRLWWLNQTFFKKV